MKRKVGRPKKEKPEPIVHPAIKIAVVDLRFGTDSPHMHENVPGDWSRRLILARFGIAEHLHVVRIQTDGKTDVIQLGRTTP